MGADDAPRAGVNAIEGVLKVGEGVKVVRVVAVDRGLTDAIRVGTLTGGGGKDAAVYEGVFTAGTGAFRVEKLLPGRAYDLIVWTKDAAGKEVRWEGVSMDYYREVVPAGEARAEDRKNIETLVNEVPTFFDRARVLRVAADHQHAAVLVESVRTRDFDSDAGGEVIYRVDLWYFENLFGGWAKVNNTEKAVVRFRGKPETLPETLQFVPELGGKTAGGAVVTMALPAVDARRGLMGRIKGAGK